MASSAEIAIRLTNVKKTFYVREHPNRTIREKIQGLFLPNRSQKIQALRDINVTINKGDFFGIVGRNGCGKSTLMNIISQVYQPDKGGKAEIYGKHIKLSLGLGFNAELTARQNIMTNGSLLGLSFKEIKGQMDDIIDFADLQEFADTPIKYYSSGMRTRLGFSIALHARADIFLLDEVFGGVGDLAFVQKAIQAFRETIVEGKTIVLISHNLGTLRQYCNRVMLIEKGEQLAVGKPADIISAYEYLIEKQGYSEKEDFYAEVEGE
jgi:ABC-2 type transport system ATP-binding protein